MFLEYAEKLADNEKIVLLQEVKPKRTLSMNSLYWVWLSCLQVENGIDRHQAHYLFRAMFLPKTDEYITGIIKPDLWERLKVKINSFHYFKGLEDIINIISESTTDQDTKLMSEFMGKIQDYSSINMGIKLLTLKDIAFQDFYLEYSNL